MDIKAGLLLLVFVSLVASAQSRPVDSRSEATANILNLQDRNAELRDQLVNSPDRETRKQIRELMAQTDQQIISTQQALGQRPTILTANERRSTTPTPQFAERQRIAEQYEGDAERRSREFPSPQVRSPIVQSERVPRAIQEIEPPVAPDAAIKSPRQSHQ